MKREPEYHPLGHSDRTSRDQIADLAKIVFETEKTVITIEGTLGRALKRISALEAKELAQ